MNKKTFPLMLIVAAALVLSACAPNALAQQEQTSQEAPRTLTVTGKATVYLTPDVAYLSIGVHTEDENASEAVEANNLQAQQVVQTLLDEGVEQQDIQTVNFSIYPMQQYGPEGQLLGVRYAVDNSVYVTLRELDRIGDIIGAATESGANSINGISFDVLDKDSALVEARGQAIENAESMAGEMAAAAEVTLGELRHINFTSTNYPLSSIEGRGMGGGAGAALDSAVPISTGQMVLNAEVTLVYEIQ